MKNVLDYQEFYRERLSKDTDSKQYQQFRQKVITNENNLAEQFFLQEQMMSFSKTSIEGFSGVSIPCK